MAGEVRWVTEGAQDLRKVGKVIGRRQVLYVTVTEQVSFRALALRPPDRQDLICILRSTFAQGISRRTPE
jgi:hypothetical protein